MEGSITNRHECLKVKDYVNEEIANQLRCSLRTVERRLREIQVIDAEENRR